MYATAILNALVEESGIEFPVFIDSPLQKFDSIHSRNVITKFYPSVSKQVVIFPLLGKELSGEGTMDVRQNIKTCPKCGMMMVKRKGKLGEFWGCKGFPDCRYTENI